MAYEIAERIESGRKTVTSAGTAVPLVAASTYCFMVLLSADLANTSPIVVGNADVVAALDAQKGVVLTPGNPPVMFLVRDVADIYVDSITDGDSVCFVYFVP